MSLLLCFFIMLFAISIIAEVRFQALADTLTQDFTGHPGTGTAKDPDPKTTTIPAASAAKNQRISSLIGGQPIPGTQGESPNVLAVKRTGETIRGGVICFELGSDQLSAQAKRDLQAALPLLQGSPQKIMVKGYTTPSEGGGSYQRDTVLAFARVLGVVEYFVSLGLQQDFFEMVVAPAEAPDMNLLPAGTDPALAGASVEMILLHQTTRSLRE